jgi:tetratricopeptide (TPR) repeat protein
MNTFKGSATPTVGVGSSYEEEKLPRRASSDSFDEDDDYERARRLVSEGKYEEAERVARAAVRELEAGDQPRLLAESLTTLALAQACAGRDEDARDTLTRAVEAATAARAAPNANAESASSEDRWAGFSLKAEVLRYEAELIERALRDAGGGVSHAARLLGFRHHQTFVALLNNRHKNLLHARNPVVPRRRASPSRSHRAPSR